MDDLKSRWNPEWDKTNAHFPQVAETDSTVCGEFHAVELSTSGEGVLRGAAGTAK